LAVTSARQLLDDVRPSRHEVDPAQSQPRALAPAQTEQGTAIVLNPTYRGAQTYVRYRKVERLRSVDNREGDDVILGECLELDQGLIGGHDAASDESKHGKQYNDRRERCCNPPSDQPRRIARLTHTTDVSLASSLSPFADT
jgi:hypothetical protein